MKKRLLTAAELAKILKVSVETIYRKTRNKEIPCIKIGRDYRYDLDEVLSALGKKINK